MGLLLWDKAKDFLTRAFTVIFVATIIIWFLQSFDIRLNVVAEMCIRDRASPELAHLLVHLYILLGTGAPAEIALHGALYKLLPTVGIFIPRFCAQHRIQHVVGLSLIHI